ncbi:hypothetical protein CcI156_06825 [Frankia sp. CcI156]|nr:hypothetical protein CgIS1_06540 [Frankia sp. CgIS1]ONH27928.1 hypothetical protein CcI156_06825 [Frankia sp. CcI156]
MVQRRPQHVADVAERRPQHVADVAERRRPDGVTPGRVGLLDPAEHRVDVMGLESGERQVAEVRDEVEPDELLVARPGGRPQLSFRWQPLLGQVGPDGEAAGVALPGADRPDRLVGSLLRRRLRRLPAFQLLFADEGLQFFGHVDAPFPEPMAPL